MVDLFPSGMRSNFIRFNQAVSNPNDKGLLPSKDLKQGQVPAQLSYTRPHFKSKLNSGLTVFSEQFASNSLTSTVGVVIKAGSRSETHETSGVAHFLEHLHFKGTEKRSRQQIELEIEQKGAHMNAYTSREYTCYYIDCLKSDVDWAIEFLGDIICNSTLTSTALEEERETILAEVTHVESDTQEFIMDNVHYTSYRYNSLGLPILGKPENIRERISVEQVKAFKDTHYTGENMYLVAINADHHERVANLTNEHFSKISRDPVNGVGPNKVNQERPIYTPSCIQIRDDDVEDAYMGLFYQVPGFNSKVFPHLLLMQRLFGNYNKEFQEEFEDQSAHYQNFHRAVWENEACKSVETNYISYADTGLFGWFGHSEDSGILNMPRNLLAGGNDKAKKVWEWELVQARNKLYTEMLEIQENTSDTFNQVAQQLVYVDRRITNQELAHRISLIDCDQMRDVADEYFLDQEMSLVYYGSIHLSMNYENTRFWNKIGNGYHFV